MGPSSIMSSSPSQAQGQAQSAVNLIQAVTRGKIGEQENTSEEKEKAEAEVVQA